MNDLEIESLGKKLQTARLSVTQLPDGNSVALDLYGRQVLTFNETGHFILQQLMGGNLTHQALIGALKSEFEVDATTAGKDIDAFLATLAQHLNR